MDIVKRLVGAAVAAGATWLTSKGITLSPDFQIGLTLAVYGIVHKALDRVF